MAEEVRHREVIDLYEGDYNTLKVLYKIMEREVTFACDSSFCPVDFLVSQSDCRNMLWVSSEAKNTSVNPIETAIKFWESGCPIYCEGVFDEKPTNHENFTDNYKKVNIETEVEETQYKCNGSLIPKEIHFIKTPPFLLFDIPSDLASWIKNLSALPKRITVYNTSYFLGGCTVHTKDHYVAFVRHNITGDFYYYDALGKGTFEIRNNFIPNGAIVSFIFYFLSNESEELIQEDLALANCLQLNEFDLSSNDSFEIKNT